MLCTFCLLVLRHFLSLFTSTYQFVSGCDRYVKVSCGKMDGAVDLRFGITVNSLCVAIDYGALAN